MIERIVAGGAILLDQVRYEPFGPVSGWVWGNGETHQRTYDLDGRLTSMTVPLEAPQLHIFGYDWQYRLNSASLDDVQLDWTYDATGNRLSETRDGATSSYEYPLDSHRLQGITGAVTKNFGYNAAGAINSDDAAPLTYDHRNRLVAGYGATYVVNGLGQRVEKAGVGANTSSGARVFVYDESGQLLGEYDGASGLAVAEHVYLGHWAVGLIRADGAYQVTPDHLGAPRSIVRGGDGAIVWNWVQEPFGTGPANAQQGFEYNPRFRGQYFDEESSQHYNMFRDYRPSLGRYVQSDPVGLVGGLSTYGYALQSPLKYADPSGLTAEAPSLPWTPARPVPIPNPGLGALGRCLGFGLGLLLTPSETSACDTIDDRPPECPGLCPPCKTISGRIVAVGTIGYRLDLVPPSAPHHPFPGNHYNLYRANQNPNNCMCFWQDIGAADAAGGAPPPAGSIPIEPFAR